MSEIKAFGERYVFIASYTLLIIGLIVINALQSLEFVSIHSAQMIRASLHLLPLMTAAVLFFIFKPIFRKEDFFNVRTGVAILLIFLVLLSVFVNGMEYESVNRMLITLIHLFNILIILPLIAKYIDIDFTIKILAKLYCGFMFFLSFLIVLNYVYGDPVWTRLGYPYIPGVYAYMSILALIISFGLLRLDVLSGFFLFNIFLSGSRSGLGIAVLVFLFVAILGRVGIRRVMMIIISLLFFSYGFFYVAKSTVNVAKPTVNVIRPYIVERKDVTSGRMALWEEGFQKIKDSPFIGYSKKILVGQDAYGRGLVVHNSFLDLSLLYGVFYALLAYMYWASFISCFVREKLHVTNLAWLLFFVVSVKSLITNTFWTNMGDGVTYLIFVLIILITTGAKRGLYGKD